MKRAGAPEPVKLDEAADEDTRLDTASLQGVERRTHYAELGGGTR